MTEFAATRKFTWFFPCFTEFIRQAILTQFSTVVRISVFMDASGL
jgi:hypothetical protein